MKNILQSEYHFRSIVSIFGSLHKTYYGFKGRKHLENLGRHTGESPETFLWISKALCSSDRPFYLPKSIVAMLHNTVNGQTLAIQNLLSLDEVESYRKTLTTLYTEFVCSDCDWSQAKRVEVTGHFLSLLDFFNSIKTTNHV